MDNVKATRLAQSLAIQVTADPEQLLHAMTKVFAHAEKLALLASAQNVSRETIQAHADCIMDILLGYPGGDDAS